MLKLAEAKGLLESALNDLTRAGRILRDRDPELARLASVAFAPLQKASKATGALADDVAAAYAREWM